MFKVWGICALAYLVAKCNFVFITHFIHGPFSYPSHFLLNPFIICNGKDNE